MIKNEKLDFNYSNITTQTNLMKYCEKNDIRIDTFNHTKMKNIVTNSIYISEELKDIDKIVFIMLYDFTAQQKYLPWVHITQEVIAKLLNKSSSVISGAFKRLEQYNLILKGEYLGEAMIIPNENIYTWGIGINLEKNSLIDRFRKRVASDNICLTEQYKLYKSEKFTSEELQK